MRFFSPSNKENIFARLLLRYFFYYLIAFLLGSFLCRRGLLPMIPSNAALLGIFPVSFALFAVLLTVGNTYLAILVMAKGTYDAALFLRIVRLAALGEINFWAFNACFFLLFLGVLLFLVAATRACLCLFLSASRDIRFIFSKGFARFLPDALCLLVLAIFSYLLWQRLLIMLPLF